MSERACEHVYFDGGCGLCHAFVRFLVARDRGPSPRFRYAPLHGPTFARRLAPAVRAQLPDSLVVETADGRVLVRSRAVAHALVRLGGGWGLCGRLLRLVPAPLADLGYRALAGVRHRLFARPGESCPRLPPELAARFDP